MSKKQFYVLLVLLVGTILVMVSVEGTKAEDAFYDGFFTGCYVSLSASAPSEKELINLCFALRESARQLNAYNTPGATPASLDGNSW